MPRATAAVHSADRDRYPAPDRAGFKLDLVAALAAYAAFWALVGLTVYWLI